MAKTEQGAFEVKYHHIEAPTKTDEEWGREHKQRRLTNPKYVMGTCPMPFCSDTLWHLKDYGWFAWRKLDGENIRVHWDGEQALWNGKTNNFTCSADFKKYMEETFPEEAFEEKFGRDKEVTLFGEHMGPKVQGNELGLDEDEFILFDVLIGNTWLEHEQIRDVANFFNLRTPADFGPGISSTLIELIDKTTQGEFKDWEGIVAVPDGRLRDFKGDRIIVKIKNKDYYHESVR